MELVSPVPSSHSALTVSALDLEGHYSFFTFYTSSVLDIAVRRNLMFESFKSCLVPLHRVTEL